MLVTFLRCTERHCIEGSAHPHIQTGRSGLLAPWPREHVSECKPSVIREHAKTYLATSCDMRVRKSPVGTSGGVTAGKTGLKVTVTFPCAGTCMITCTPLQLGGEWLMESMLTHRDARPLDQQCPNWDVRDSVVPGQVPTTAECST